MSATSNDIAVQSAWKRVLRDPAFLVGAGVLLVIVLGAVFAPWIAPHNPDAQNVMMVLAGPSAQHPLGNDSFGRDVLSRILYGARISLYVGAVSTIAGVLVGTVVGLIAGYLGGVVDRLVTSLTDILLSFPQIIMGLLVVAALGPSMTNLIIAIAITVAPAFVRIARASTLTIRERDYIDACRALGFSKPRIMFGHIFPNILDELVVLASLWLATAIRTEATLAFIGLGAPPPTATWGGIVRDGFDNILDAPWLSVFPSLAILAVMLALNMMGDAMRDVTDPKGAR